MASYLPGSVDYIPHIQPFRPDFNFYQASLERKEAQYQQGYNKISGIYSSLLNSPMLRDIDNKRRDQFFKQAQDNIGKISEMDLSLQENQDAAYQVFQPLIDDKHIMKDMAWTKNYQNEVGRAEGFRNCIDEKKCGGKWWEDGVRALNYYAEDFSKSTDDDAMGFDSPKYVPYSNIPEKAMKAAKDMGFNISSVSWSKDGRYIVTQKNGAAMVAPLSQYFLGVFGQDPQAQEVYKTEAYLKRKDFIRANTEKYGSEDGAENFYLTSIMNATSTTANENSKKTFDIQNDISSKKQILSDKINGSGGLESDDPLVQQYLSLNNQASVMQGTQDHYDQTKNYLDKSAMVGADKKALRWRIDNAVANTLLSQDLLGAANTFSELNSETKVEADPYAKSSYDHMLKMSELHQQKLDELDLKREDYKMKLDYQQALEEMKKRRRGKLGNNVYAPAPDAFQGQSSTGDIVSVQQELQSKAYEEQGKVFSGQDTYLKTLFNHLQSIANSDNPSVSSALKASAAADLHKIFGDDYNIKTKQSGTPDIADGKNYKANRDAIYKNAVGYSKILNTFYDGLNDKLKPIESSVQKDRDLWSTYDSILKLNNKSLKNWAQSSANIPEDRREMFQDLITDDGRLLSKEQFAKKWAAKHGTAQDDTNPSYSTSSSNPNTYANSYEKASREYDGVVDLYSKLYRSNPVVNTGGKQVPVIKTWDPSAQLGGAGYTVGGGKTTNAVITDIDGAYEDEGLMDAIRVYDSYKSKGAIGVTFGYDQENTEDDPGAKRVLDAYFEDIKNGQFKDTDLKRPAGQFVYSGVALGDPNKVAFHFIPNGEWAMQPKFKGTSKAQGITYDQKYAEGITVYMDKDKVSKDFMNKFEHGPYETILNYKDVIIDDYPDAGSVILSKKGSTGVSITGTINYTDADGNLVPVNASTLGLDPMVDPDMLVNQIKYNMKMIHNQNQMYKTNKKPGPIKNTSQLDNPTQ